MKKWYSVELFDTKEITLLKAFLKEYGVKFETSGCGNGVHFEVEMTEDELATANNFMEGM